MGSGFRVDVDELHRIEKLLHDAGTELNDQRNRISAEPADAGISTAALEDAVHHVLETTATLLDDLDKTVSTLSETRSDYQRMEDNATRGMRECHDLLAPFQPTYDPWTHIP